jgi:23S rRNA (guanosine2251-2'-O)-methyltransferase
VIGRAREAGVAVEELSPAEFDRRVPGRTVHQGVLLEAGPLPPTTLEALVDPPGDAWLVALDGIEDPQNLGAVLRVAEAAGVRGALLPDRRAAPLTAAVARASAGALEHLPVVSVPNLTRALSYAKKREFWVHAADPAGDLDLYDLPERLLGGRLVLVLGAEGRGIRPGVRASVDLRVRIPMAGAVGSLNVASAAAVVLFEWARRRRRRGGSPGGEHP